MTRRYSKSHLSAALRLGVNPETTLVRDYFGPFASNVNGPMYGIEVEIEDKNDRYPSEGSMEKFASYWSSVNDGSLRNSSNTGAGGREFISNRPLDFSSVPLALQELEDLFKRSRMALSPSIRTSVHVHVNVQDMTLNQLVKYLILYYLVEPLLGQYNGAERAHNLFCVQACQSPLLIDELIYLFENKKSQSGLKYSALNFMPLIRRRGVATPFGTTEFRQGQGVQKTPMEILPWVEMINEIRTSADKIGTPAEIIQSVSSLGVVEFLKIYLPVVFKNILPVFKKDVDEIEYLVFDSLRVIQPLVFDINWKEGAPKKKTRKESSLRW